MNSSELNLQHLYYNIILFDITMSDAVTAQIINHFQHFEQMHIIHVYNIWVQNSFNMQQTLNNMSKAVSEIITELNSIIFKIKIDDIKDNIIIEYWTKILNEHLINKDDSEAAEILKNTWLEKDNIIMIFLKLISEKKVIII